MTLYTIVRDVSRRLSLGEPTAVIASTDPLVLQLRGLADQEGRDLVRTYAWRVLLKEKTITTLAQEIQTSAIPSDFDRFVMESIYNRDDSRQVIGPLTAQEWQAEKAITSGIVRDAFRIRGADFIVTPVPSAGETWAYEYVSDLWVDTNQDGTGNATAFEADDDTILFTEELLTLGIIWRFKQAKGLDYSEEFRNYTMARDDAIARDGGRRTISLGVDIPGGARVPALPDGNFTL